MAEPYRYPFPDDLFTTNRAQTDEEWTTLKRLITICDTQIAIIDQEISDRNDERKRLVNGIVPFQRALAPFRRLPADIIREIFAACIDRTRNSTLAPNEAPTLLTHISSGMRRLALSTPELWTAIHIPITRYVEGTKYIRGIRKSDIFPYAHGVEEWLLRRSGDMPLRISVDELESGPMTLKYTNALTDEIVRIMLLCCSRWKDISLGLVSGSLLHFQNIYPYKIPLLRSVSITGQHSPVEHGPVYTAWERSWMLTAPSLERFYVDLQQIQRQGGTCQLKVNWANLTHLGFGGLVWAHSADTFMLTCVPILLQTTRIVKLKIDAFAEGSNIYPFADIHLPFLQVLEVDERCHFLPSQEPGVLQLIKAPKLRTLIYSSRDSPSPILFPPPSLVSLLENAQEVKELSVSFSRDRPSREAYRAVLGLCPHLTVLRILHSERVDGNILLPELVLNDSKQCLCPALEAFWCSSALFVTPEILSDFVSHKRGTVSHLKCWKALTISEIIFDLANDTHDLALITELTTKVNGMLSATNSYPFDQRVFWDQKRVCGRQSLINHPLP